MDSRLRVLRALRDQSGITITEVAGRTRLSPERVSDLLNELVPSQVVTEDRDPDGPSCYYLNAKVAENWAGRARSPKRRGFRLLNA
jgi:DNA-binding IclR family transcriptional regulator